MERASHYLRYLAILFGGILLVDWVLSLSLPAEAAYHLTKASLDAAMVVAVLGLVFRSRLNIKITFIATGLLSLGLAFWVFSVRHNADDMEHAWYGGRASSQQSPFATLPTLAHLKAQNPGMDPHEFKELRAATGLSRILGLHKDSKPLSAIYLADGTVCYHYSFAVEAPVEAGDNPDVGWTKLEYGVLTTDGSLYVNAVDTVWKQLCKEEKGDELIEAAK